MAESGVVSPVSVATKGMGVTTDRSVVYLWNYNQDPLDAWDGETLTTIASGLVSSYGTDLVVDGDNAVYVSKDDSSTGEIIMKWDGATGEAL